MKLSELAKGKKAVILSIDLKKGELKERLEEMGIYKNVEIEFLRKAPFGSPLQYILNKSSPIIIRKEYAEKIEVKYIFEND